MTDDRAELSERDEREAMALIARYAHLVDDGDFAGLSKVFTEDAVIEWVNDQGSTSVRFGQLASLWAASNHPSAHLSTNAVCEAAEGDTIRVRSKGLAVESDGRSWSVVYNDQLVRTPQGWRICKRVVLERPSIARLTRQQTVDPAARSSHAQKS